MLHIEEFREEDRAQIVAFVEAIQEHERRTVPELRSGGEIGPTYTEELLRTVKKANGLILIARHGDETIGFVSGWNAIDDDPLVREEARRHGYVSDIFVAENWRRKGIGRRLLDAIEAAMSARGCSRMRINAKATNSAAVKFYGIAGYQPYEIAFSKIIKNAPRGAGEASF